jgi:hypothetical protein
VYEPLAGTAIEGNRGAFNGSLAASNGRLFLRSDRYLC